MVIAHVLDSVLTKVLFSTPKGLLELPVIVIAGAAIPRTVEDAYILPYTVSHFHIAKKLTSEQSRLSVYSMSRDTRRTLWC